MPREDRDPGWLKRRREARAASGDGGGASPRPIQEHPNYGAWMAAFECSVRLEDADELIAVLGPAEAERFIRRHGPSAALEADAHRYWRGRGVDPGADAGTVRLAELAE